TRKTSSDSHRCCLTTSTCWAGTSSSSRSRSGREGYGRSATPRSPMIWLRSGPYSSFLFHCVRHDGIARSVLLFQKEVTTPAVLPAVPYRGVRRRQRRG